MTLPCSTHSACLGTIRCAAVFSHPPQEIDLVAFLLLLWRSRLWLIVAVTFFAVSGAGIGVLKPVNVISEARVIPAQYSELQAQEPLQELLATEQIAVPLDSNTWFTDFIQHWDSAVLQQAWLWKSGVKEPERIQFSRASSTYSSKSPLYSYELLRVSAPEPKTAQFILKGYLAFVCTEVNRDIAIMVRQSARQQLVTRALKNDGVEPLLASLYVQPYALQASPSLPVRTQSRIILFAALGAMLGFIAVTFVLLMKDVLKEKRRYVAH